MEISEIYKCNICGNIVELVKVGGGDLVCCGEPMEKLSEKTQDAGLEKHVPVVEKAGNALKVKVGSVPHPMEPAHHIQFIEVLADGKVYRKHLEAGQKPEAEFTVTAETFTVREYCNLHGLWKA